MEWQLDAGVLLNFALLWLAIVPTPGANSLLITHVAMTRPPSHLAAAIAGNMCGMLLLAAGALLGWAATLDALPWLRRAVNLLGAIYLMYFGARLLWRSRAVAVVPASDAETNLTQPDLRRTFALGFLTAVSNAQAVIFITSIFAVAGVLQANLGTGLASVLVMVGCNASYLALLGWLFQRPAVRMAYTRFRKGLEGVMGVLFLGFGGRLMIRELVWRP